MKITDLGDLAFSGLLTEADLVRFALVSDSTIHDACNALAEYIAEEYLQGHLSWESGDAAMNHLYTLAYVRDEFCLPEFASRVYEAFDEGEYAHREPSPSADGPPRTTNLLIQLLRSGA